MARSARWGFFIFGRSWARTSDCALRARPGATSASGRRGAFGIEPLHLCPRFMKTRLELRAGDGAKVAPRMKVEKFTGFFFSEVS